MGGSDMGLIIGMGMHPSVGVHRYGARKGFCTGAGDVQWTHQHRSWGHVGGLIGRMLDGKGCVTIMTYTVTQGVLGHAYLLQTGLCVCDCAFICAGVNMKALDHCVGRRSNRPSVGVASATHTKTLNLPVVVTNLKRCNSA